MNSIPSPARKHAGAHPLPSHADTCQTSTALPAVAISQQKFVENISCLPKNGYLSAQLHENHPLPRSRIAPRNLKYTLATPPHHHVSAPC
eukprot:182877-Chlamydomonas_euryale.AAC.8